MNQKKKFSMPHNYVIIFCIILIATLMTYVIPAGTFDREVNEMGRKVVVDGSFHYVEQTPVSPFGIFECIATGFNNTASIIFFVVFAFGWVNILLQNGTFNSLMGAVIRKFGDRIELLIPVCMIGFGILGSTIGISEETHGLVPVFVAIGVALGYDAIVGAAMVYVGVSTGFASATLNPFTVGVAMGIAEVDYPYGIGFRVLCFALFEGIAIFYTMRYARKIKKDPTKSILYGTKLDLKINTTKEELVNSEMTTRHKICGVIFVAVLAIIVYGTTALGWYINELSALFIIAMIVSGFVGGMGPNQIAQSFIQAARDMMFGALVIGLARGIVTVLDAGCVTDTIIYGLSVPISHMSSSLGAASQYVCAIAMLVVQNIINCFIGSGSGQASAVMPIMAPLSDMVGVTRQTAVLAFQFGDGYSNMFWPNGALLLCGLAGLPVDKWYKFIAPLFGLMFCLQIILVCVAVAIGF